MVCKVMDLGSLVVTPVVVIGEQHGVVISVDDCEIAYIERYKGKLRVCAFPNGDSGNVVVTTIEEGER